MRVDCFDSVWDAIEPSKAEAAAPYPPRSPGRWIAEGETVGLVAMVQVGHPPLRPFGAPPRQAGRRVEAKRLNLTQLLLHYTNSDIKRK